MKHYYIPDEMYEPETPFSEVKHSVQFNQSVDKDMVVITIENKGQLYGVKVPLSQVKEAIQVIES